jgi:hypothetical protein
MRDMSKLKRLAATLDADVYISIRWRGGEIDRLMDEGHAAVVGWVIATLSSLGWEARPEVSYAVWRESGSIDVLAWHAPTRTLLVVEVKTELTSLEETLRKHDAKQRLASEIAADRFGWTQPRLVSRLLVLPDSTSTRRAVERHGAVLGSTYRLRADEARAWLKSPAEQSSLLLFAPLTRRVRGRRDPVSRRRVRAGGSRSPR